VELSVRNEPERLTFTVVRHDGYWAVEHDGEHFDHSLDKEVAKAAANKRARAAHDSGRACLVRVSGENGFYAAA
jgi:hypothetical protein